MLLTGYFGAYGAYGPELAEAEREVAAGARPLDSCDAQACRRPLDAPARRPWCAYPTADDEPLVRASFAWRSRSTPTSRQPPPCWPDWFAGPPSPRRDSRAALTVGWPGRRGLLGRPLAARGRGRLVRSRPQGPRSRRGPPGGARSRLSGRAEGGRTRAQVGRRRRRPRSGRRRRPRASGNGPVVAARARGALGRVDGHD